MSATVLVDNVYVARMMRGARHSARLKRNNAAKIFVLRNVNWHGMKVVKF